MKTRLLNYFLLSLSCVMLIASCSKKNDPVATNPLIGSWKYVSETFSNCTDPLDNKVETCTTDCITISFTSTKYTITIPGAGGYTDDYTVSGNSLTLKVAGQTQETFTYAVSGTTLTFTAQGGATNCTETTVFVKI